MGRILQYILIFLLSSPAFVFGQQKKEVWRYEGPRIGVDLSRFLLSNGKKGFEIQADYPVKGNFFPTVEVGYQSVTDQNSNFRYNNQGAYGRLGVDMNITKFESLSDNDLVFVGLRYGFSRFSHESSGVTYSNYWGTLNTSFPQRTLNAHWSELVFGMKGELLPNIFFGWSIRAKFLISKTKDPNTSPYIIPGLGNMAAETPFDFSVTASYRFPIFKTKVLPKALKGGSNKRDPDDEPDPDDPENNNQNNGNRGNYNNSSGGSRQMMNNNPY